MTTTVELIVLSLAVAIIAGAVLGNIVCEYLNHRDRYRRALDAWNTAWRYTRR